MNGQGSRGFVQHAKARLFSADADPAHHRMHAGSRLALQQSERKSLPTDDTQHTEDMDLYKGVTQPTNMQIQPGQLLHDPYSSA